MSEKSSRLVFLTIVAMTPIGRLAQSGSWSSALLDASFAALNSSAHGENGQRPGS